VGVVVGLVVLWNRTLKAQVELRTRELRESERQRRQSEKLAALGNVVGAVAHEVRNPLFAISANVDVLEARLGDAEENSRNLESLRTSVNRLSQLMNDLLDYGRTDGDGLERGDALRPALEEAVALAIPLAQQKGIRLQASICESPPLDIDAPRLTRAVRNLMENAIQHSPEDGSVQLIAERHGPGWLEVRVEDAGPGFPPESASHLFEPFFTLRRGGTGLGLAIVERVAAAHGATVGAAIRESGGAAVWIRLPVPPQGDPDQTSTP
jgi:signal transduction histidine kinase